MSQLFLGAPWAEKVTLSPKIPKGKSCDTSQNFPTGHTKFLAWSERLIQKKVRALLEDKCEMELNELTVMVICYTKSQA